MNPITLLFVLGLGGLVAYEVSQSSSKPATPGGGGGGNGPVSDCSTTTDCTTLGACVSNAIAKAGVSDVPTLQRAITKANALGCSDLATILQEKIALLTSTTVAPVIKDLPPVPSPAPSVVGKYSVVSGIGQVSSASDGDMIIVVLKSTDGSYYLTPLSLSGKTGGVYEKTLAMLAVTKFKAELGKAGASPATLLSIVPGTVNLNPPPDLPDGIMFSVAFATSTAMGFVVPGQVIYVVTAAQMASDITGESVGASVGYTWGDTLWGGARKRNVQVSGAGNVGTNGASHFGQKRGFWV